MNNQKFTAWQISSKNMELNRNQFLEFERLNREYQLLAEPIKEFLKEGIDYNIDGPFAKIDNQNTVYILAK
ncbi:MAG: hypothetical protein OXH39_08515 [Candidatus Poribacteria bacterium]|nr:hypothetical protein [Candidatus Poribacteria bacterium]